MIAGRRTSWAVGVLAVLVLRVVLDDYCFSGASRIIADQLCSFSVLLRPYNDTGLTTHRT
jgi:hypothetical protein